MGWATSLSARLVCTHSTPHNKMDARLYRWDDCLSRESSTPRALGSGKINFVGCRGCASLIRGGNVYLNGNFFDEDVGLKGKVCMLRVLAISAMDEEMLVDELEGYDFGCFPLKPH